MEFFILVTCLSHSQGKYHLADISSFVTQPRPQQILRENSGIFMVNFNYILDF